MNHREIIATAKQEFRAEQFRAAVEAEKARMRQRRTIWQRIKDALPLTVKWGKK